ncbi:phenylacetaldoxime dehydratase family protein [Xenophilus azovorans]|uniref:phenylacetaldoxime dehydratase family protein n=1 Tax=Xenophilus azovorans TaxID=151755 RepID=UPI000570EE8D|nr:phenylacetaldoxime dehydratase family protein [Xenophilus azovorans]
MESAIAEHLRCPRTRQRRVEDDYAPPYPAWAAHAPAAVTRVVIGLFGVQSRGAGRLGQACAALRGIAAGFAAPDGPLHHDLTHGVDADGFDNMVAIGYWTDAQAFARWRDAPAVRGWWQSEERLHEGIGYFREIATPHVARFETLFSTPDALEGAGVAMGRLSGEIQEHGYWGSMRDRLPLSQTDAMRPSGARAVAADVPEPGRRVRIAGHDHLALIRSGQDWSGTQGRERMLYLEQIEPVLRAGMDFLERQGLQVGCYSNRYMRHLDAAGQPQEKSFGLSFWRALADMERWSESHPTHVEIFGAFMRYVQALNLDLKLRLYHEVAVLGPDEQFYEYVNCHPRTGLMNGLGA